jgi:hypothetical protein
MDILGRRAYQRNGTIDAAIAALARYPRLAICIVDAGAR